MTLTLTHVGGPTLLIEVEGWRILTDPTFDAPGKKYNFGWGTSSVKLAGPAVGAEALGAIDVALVSHDHHEDNLDAAGRAWLPRAGAVVTTTPGAKRLRGELGGAFDLRGLDAWATTVVEAEGKPALRITATPCRHGPPGSRPIVGDVIGFALDVEGHGTVWITGDTVLYDGVREVAQRLDVDVAVVHLGGVRFPVSGPLRYTMTGAEAIELMDLVKPRLAVPIHYEGWKHFREGRAAVEAADASGRFTWLEPGVATPLT